MFCALFEQKLNIVTQKVKFEWAGLQSDSLCRLGRFLTEWNYKVSQCCLQDSSETPNGTALEDSLPNSKSVCLSSVILSLQSWFQCSRLQLSWPHEVFHQGWRKAYRKRFRSRCFWKWTTAHVPAPQHRCFHFSCPITLPLRIEWMCTNCTWLIVPPTSCWLWVERVASFPFTPTFSFFFFKEAMVDCWASQHFPKVGCKY